MATFFDFNWTQIDSNQSFKKTGENKAGRKQKNTIPPDCSANFYEFLYEPPMNSYSSRFKTLKAWRSNCCWLAKTILTLVILLAPHQGFTVSKHPSPGCLPNESSSGKGGSTEHSHGYRAIPVSVTLSFLLGKWLKSQQIVEVFEIPLKKNMIQVSMGK